MVITNHEEEEADVVANEESEGDVTRRRRPSYNLTVSGSMEAIRLGRGGTHSIKPIDVVKGFESEIVFPSSKSAAIFWKEVECQ